MFFFSSAPSFYRHSGLALLLLQLNLFVFGLPPFHAGVWVQTEPVMLVEYIFAAFTGLWLVIGLSRKWLAQLSAHPLWIALLLWTLWQLIPTVLATSPWRSWFGPPQTGEGVAWNVVLLLNFMLACPLWQVARLRNILLGAAALQIAVNCPLYLYYDGGRENFYPLESWTPIQFPTFLAFQGIYLFIAAALAGLFRTRKNYIHAALALAVVLIISRCRSAMALCAVAITTSLLKFPRPGKLWRGLAIAACFSPLLWVALCHYAPDAAMLYNKESLLRPRVILNQVAVAALENEPSRVWIGNGWGRFGDDMFKYILVDGVDVYQHGARNPNTIMVDGGAFLSHSQPLEAFLSMGIVGFALWFAIPVIAIITLPELFFWPVAPIIVAWTMLGFVWFQFIECVPYEALTLAALANARPLAASKRSPVAMAILLLLLIVAMGWSVRQQAEALLYDAQIIEISRTTPETGNAIGGSRSWR